MTARKDTPTPSAPEAVVADRRSFLKRAGAGIVTTGAAVVGAATGTEAAPESASKSEPLYRETAHVRRYYDIARNS